MTTSFDLRSAHRHRRQWGPLPVWPQLLDGLGGEAGDGLAHRQRMATRDERHQAARTALTRAAPHRAAIALAAYPHIPPGRP